MSESSSGSPQPEITVDVPQQPSTSHYLSMASTGDQTPVVSTGCGEETTSVPKGDRFTVLRHHARGGLGQILLARDEKLNRNVALKEIRPDKQASAVLRRRFLMEAEITARLEHPGIVPVYTIEEGDGGQPYYAMRFIEGRTLAETIQDYHRQPEPLAFRDLLQRFVSVCQTIAYAHSKDVIHRDLKPDNVMLGVYGETLVLDWGLAKVVVKGQESAAEEVDEPAQVLHTSESRLSDDRLLSPDSLTQAGQVLGTAAYMSPEQADGDSSAIGFPTDIYALGAILYEILTGQPVYRGRNLAEVLAQVKAGRPAAPAAVKREVPSSIEAVCLKALALNPTDRYDSAGEVAGEVNRWLADEPVLAYREPLRVKARRWVRRHQTLTASAVVLLLAALAGLTVNTLLLGEANQRTGQQRDRAEANLDKAKEAVDLCFTAASENPLLEGDQMQPIRELLHRAALKYYQDFIDQRHDVPALRAELARNHQRVAYISNELGSVNEAISHDEQARDIWQALVVAHPTDPDSHFGLAKTLSHLGFLTHEQLSRRPEALAMYDKTIQLLERLVQDHPRSAPFRHELAQAYYHQGYVYREIGKFDQAEASNRQGLAIYEKLVQDQPDDLRFASMLAGGYGEMGNLQGQQARPLEALDWYARNLSALEPLLTREPRYTHARRLLGSTYYNRATLFRGLGRQTDAAKDWRRILELSEGQSDIHVRMNRAFALSNSGQHARAVAEVESMVSRGQKPIGAYYNFACIYALSSSTAAVDERLTAGERGNLAERYGARAVAMLNTARDEGAFKDPGFVTYIEKDMDLAALHLRGDFQKLLRDLKNMK